MLQLALLAMTSRPLLECGVACELSAPASDMAKTALLIADFFTSAVQLRLPVVVTAIVLLYLTSFSFFGVVWYLVYRCVVKQHLQLLYFSPSSRLSIAAGCKVNVSGDFMALFQPLFLQRRLSKP